MSAEQPEKTNRTKLLLVAAVCIAPFIGSFALYFFWQPSGRVNYGDLLEPVATVPAESLKLATGEPFEFRQLAGKWVYVTVDSGECDEYCRGKLWKMRQVRRTQGKYMDRVERVWLLTDERTPDPALVKEFEGSWNVAARASGLVGALPHAGTQRDHIYLVDPLGNIVLRYPRDADPSRMKKDLNRLLKVSRIG